jgi:DNA modification methylase
LSGDVPGQLTPACPHCGGSDLRYVEDHFRPGIVLDPFAGSGTTLAVATGHGRDAIGIDIDARNADLAVERVGMLLTVEGAA